MIRIITEDELKELIVPMDRFIKWVEDVFQTQYDDAIQPTKIRMPIHQSDYFNVMPCVLPDCRYMGVKVVTRSEYRVKHGQPTIDADILLYDYKTAELLAVMDGSYITTVRTAAVAVHSILNLVSDYSTISMVGLGRIGNSIADILFNKCKAKCLRVKLYNYKNYADKFIEKYSGFGNITFEKSNSYEDLMKDSDVIISAVSYIDGDFCHPDCYKKGCTVIPVHLRGFMDCDIEFDHIITSDMVSIQKFKNYPYMRKVTLINDIIKGKECTREKVDDRVLVYNCGLAIYDIYFAAKMYEMYLNHCK